MTALDFTQRCFYCGFSVDSVRDCWIEHGTMAHYQCAWGADEVVWVRLDVRGAVEEKRHDECL